MYQTGYVGGRLKQGAFEHPLPDIVSNEVRTPKLVTLGATGVTIAVELIEYDILSTPGPRHAQFALEIVPPREGIDGEPLVASSVENSEFVYETRIGHHSVFVILAGSEE